MFSLLFDWPDPGHVYPSGDAGILRGLFLKPSLWGVTTLFRRPVTNGSGKGLQSQNKTCLSKEKYTVDLATVLALSTSFWLGWGAGVWHHFSPTLLRE